MRKTTLLFAAALALPGASLATPTVSGDGACGIRAVDNESFVTCEGERASPPAAMPASGSAPVPAVFAITARQAVQMKADFGPGVLLADIRAFEAGPRLIEHLDNALLENGLRHGDPVIVLVRSEQQARLTAPLMGEHGYHQVFVVSELDEGRLAARRILP
jgi:hypothetical protein